MFATRTAKLFKNGASQAVRLPADFRFEGDEVYVTRDERTGDVILSSQPSSFSWAALFDLLAELDESEEFMADRPLNVPPRDRSLFEGD